MGPELYSFILFPITQLAYAGYIFNVSYYAYDEVFADLDEDNNIANTDEKNFSFYLQMGHLIIIPSVALPVLLWSFLALFFDFFLNGLKFIGYWSMIGVACFNILASYSSNILMLYPEDDIKTWLVNRGYTPRDSLW